MTDKQLYAAVREAQENACDEIEYDNMSLADLQRWIDNGQAWHTAGSIGRACMQAMQVGACMLGSRRQRDAYGNTVPSYRDVQAGSKGSLELACEYWGIDC